MTVDAHVPGPLAAALADQVAALPAPELTRLLLALGGGPRLDAGADRAYLCLAAVAACHADLRRAPLADDYTGWRAAQPRPDEWPTADFVLRTFRGRWAPALSALGLRLPPTERVRRNSPQLGPYRRDELLAGLRAFIATLPPGAAVRQADYQAWARRRLTEPGAPARLCLHPQPFIREFGCWSVAAKTAQRPLFGAFDTARPGQARPSGPKSAKPLSSSANAANRSART